MLSGVNAMLYFIKGYIIPFPSQFSQLVVRCVVFVAQEGVGKEYTHW